MQNEGYDLVILDEINVAVDFNLISLKDVIELIEHKPESLELVLTGRYASPEIIKHADIVSEILEIKHPYQKGVQSRKGIDW
jgi:cob(I)alamin adenosyltransferase